MGIHIIFIDKPKAKSRSKVQAHVKSKRGKEGICLCTLTKISWFLLKNSEGISKLYGAKKLVVKA